MKLDIGMRIKLKRLELGITQSELATRMGYKSKTAICKVETGDDNNLTTERVKQFAAALGVTPAYLMGWEDGPEPDILEMPNTIKMRKMFEAYSKLDPQIQKIVDGILGMDGD